VVAVQAMLVVQGVLTTSRLVAAVNYIMAELAVSQGAALLLAAMLVVQGLS
jgi:hypothetical protein